MRFHLFEFTDLKWYPGFLKKPIQEYLDFVSRRFGIFEPAIPIIEEGLRESGHSLILDLGSGAGGGSGRVGKPQLPRSCWPEAWAMASIAGVMER